jgi:hypothetical protein
MNMRLSAGFSGELAVLIDREADDPQRSNISRRSLRTVRPRVQPFCQRRRGHGSIQCPWRSSVETGMIDRRLTTYLGHGGFRQSQDEQLDRERCKHHFTIYTSAELSVVV